MDPELVALASAAASTVVKLMTTSVWEKAKAALGGLWRRAQPERVEMIEADLEETRSGVLTAQQAGDAQAEEDAVAEWQGRLRRLLASDPDLSSELRRILEQVWEPALASAGISLTMNATAIDRGRVYQAGRDQHITER